jgi:hypothetical protein
VPTIATRIVLLLSGLLPSGRCRPDNCSDISSVGVENKCYAL